MITFSSLAGAPVRYDRDEIAPYGSRGRSHPFLAERDFIAVLENCFAELWTFTSFGAGECVTSAGAYTDKPGQHGIGRAFDLDGVFWQKRTFVSLYDGFWANDRRFYFGVECVLRRYFGQVLNYHYNAAHRDHFHIDDARPVGLRRESRALVLFVQGMLVNIFAEPLTVSGDWCEETQLAVHRAARHIGLGGPLTEVEEWRHFLAVSARLALQPSATDARAVSDGSCRTGKVRRCHVPPTSRECDELTKAGGEG